MSPIHPHAALRDLLHAWHKSVEDDPDATPEYREWVREAVTDAYAEITDGASAYYTLLLTVAPGFASANEELVQVVDSPDDEEVEVATVRQEAQAGHGGRMVAPIYLELGDTPGNTPETPPEHREAARNALELLLTGWEGAVQQADVSDRYRRVVAETAERVRDSLRDHTTVHHLICNLLAPAFLLPDEADMTGLTTADLEALGAVLHWGDDTSHLYPSLFDRASQFTKPPHRPGRTRRPEAGASGARAVTPAKSFVRPPRLP